VGSGGPGSLERQTSTLNRCDKDAKRQ
jgi:hypothetical protein